jgi:hypothetical protein
MTEKTKLNQLRKELPQSIRWLTAICMIVSMTACAQDAKVESELKIHRLDSENTSPYDAFAYLNRVPDINEGEDPKTYAGHVLLSRLANEEGRILIKIVDGFNRSAYYGYKSFMRYWPEEDLGMGGCVVCHHPPNFADAGDKKYIVDSSGIAKAVPPLRNTKRSKDELKAIIEKKIKLAEMARAGKADNIDESYKLMKLSTSDVDGIAEFIRSMISTPKEGYRDLILSATILDTTDVYN